MKHCILALFFIVVSFQTTFSQEDRYFVAHLKGQIIHSATGKPLKVGDVVSSADAIVFASPEAKAIVMHTQKGRWLLDGKKATKNDSGEFLSFVKDVLMPGATDIRLSTRGGLNYDLDYRKVQDFKGFFGEGRYVFIGDELKIGTDLTRFPVGATHSFVYSYTANGASVKNRLGVEGSNVVFNKQKLYRARGVEINPQTVEKAELVYFNESTKEETKLTTFQPIFVDEKTLVLEIKSVAGFLNSNNVMEADKIKNELFDFVLEVYGPINRNVFNDWLASKELIGKM
jgi:hypothetical protein